MRELLRRNKNWSKSEKGQGNELGKVFQATKIEIERYNRTNDINTDKERERGCGNDDYTILKKSPEW